MWLRGCNTAILKAESEIQTPSQPSTLPFQTSPQWNSCSLVMLSNEARLHAGKGRRGSYTRALVLA